MKPGSSYTGRSVAALAAAVTMVLFVGACGDDGSAPDGGTPAESDETGDGGGAGAGGEGAQVEIVSVGEGFDPATITVTAGTEVSWTNVDGLAHTATAGEGAWDSGRLATDQTFSFTPTEAGTYSYFCSIHPSMTGELVVQ